MFGPSFGCKKAMRKHSVRISVFKYLRYGLARTLILRHAWSCRWAASAVAFGMVYGLHGEAWDGAQFQKKKNLLETQNSEVGDGATSGTVGNLASFIVTVL